MQINGTTKVYGIMGHPVAHSLSPALHNAAFQACGLNKVYVPFDVVDLPRAMDGFRALGVGGVSVTIPHKQAIIPHLDDIDPVAEKIGAVNTLLIEDNHIRGYNSDWIGANKALETIVDLPAATVLVLGAGGAARAIAFGLKEKGATVMIANRTVSKGEALARDLNCEYFPLSEIEDLEADALVNATSIGMLPAPEATPAPQALLQNIKAVMDAVYAPMETRLLAEAKQLGCKTVDGTQMLLFQGVAQFELWTGRAAPVEIMRKQLFSHLKGNAGN
jgi:shikimate dehydrogenase